MHEQKAKHYIKRMWYNITLLVYLVCYVNVSYTIQYFSLIINYVHSNFLFKKVHIVKLHMIVYLKH